jgi:hypothetical protein
MNSDEAHRRAEALFKRPSWQRPSTTPNSVLCKKKLRGCGHCGWLATRLIKAARQNRTRHGDRQQGVHHLKVHGSLPSP